MSPLEIGTLSIIAIVVMIYLGFYIPKNSHMNYKADYRPCELLIDGTWKLFRDAGGAYQFEPATLEEHGAGSWPVA